MLGRRDYFAVSVHLLVFGLIAAVGGMFALAQVIAPQPPPLQRTKVNAPDTSQATQQEQAAGQQSQVTQPRQQGERTARKGQQRGEGDRQAGRAADVAWLGVYLQGDEGDNQKGARIMHVYPAGPAARAGLRGGDVITQVNGQQIPGPQDLISAIEGLQPQSKAELVVLRGNQEVKIPATLGSRDSFVFRSQEQGEYGEGRESNEDDFYSNIPPYAMQMEHDRRNAEQHQRIEEELRKLQEEIRQLREAVLAKK